MRILHIVPRYELTKNVAVLLSLTMTVAAIGPIQSKSQDLGPMT